MASQTEGHPSDATLLAVIHGEPVGDLVAIRAHAGECTQCTARQRTMAEDDAMIEALLAELDDPLRSGDQPRFEAKSRHSWVQRGIRVAAAAATLAVAAAALVVPASPLHQWVFRETGTPTRGPVVATSPQAAAVASGIAVPASRSLVIVLRHEQRQGALEIRWTAVGDVTFRSRGGIAAYQVASGQVTIDNQVAADAYQIDIPRSVQHLRILVGTRVLLRWPEDSARRVSPTGADELRLPLDAAGADAH